jgi:hypothetical protein
VVPAWKFLGPLPEDGEGGPIFGISPAHDDSLHLVNGWLASVEGDDLPPLRFVRHGHLRGWPRIHVTAKPSPAVAELLNLALRCQERVEKDLADRPTADGKPRNVALRIASLQLMTAGARSWLCDGDRPGEQHREWERVEKLGVSIQFSQNPTDQPQPLLLRPKVLSFNFPVNPWFHRLGGVRLLGWMPIPDDPSLSLMASTDAAFHVLLGKNCADGEAGPGRWHISRCQDWQEICKKCGPNGRVEEAALRLWDEDSLVGAALRDGARTDRERWQILQLARQVLGLCQLTKRRSSVFLPRRALRSYENFCHCGNPYAMPARVFLLCHMLGIPCACNCRSGKDRTGIFHGEVAYLWLRMHCDEAGTVPEPWSAAKNLDWQERLDRVRVLDACGSGHILTSCTGFYGYRVQDDRWWMRALLKFPFLEKFYGPVIGASWLAES